MELLYNLVKEISDINSIKKDNHQKQIKLSDALDYALLLVDYIEENEENIDKDSLFMSKYILEYFINNLNFSSPRKNPEEKSGNEAKLQDLKDKMQNCDYTKKIKSFDEFIASLYFPLVAKGNNTTDVISHKGFYKTADDLYQTMRLAVVQPNDRLLKQYDKKYKGIKLEYIKMITSVVLEEFPKYNIELNEADKQFIQLCEMINKYLKSGFVKFSYHQAASTYSNTSMEIILRKIKGKNE